MKTSLDWKIILKIGAVSVLMAFVVFAFISLDKPTPLFAALVTGGTFAAMFFSMAGLFMYLQGDFERLK